jgi:hypothetical protein
VFVGKGFVSRPRYQNGMVTVEHVTRLNERRDRTSSELFPETELESIRSVVEAVPETVFQNMTERTEVGEFDAEIASGLPQYEYEYEYEGESTGDFNPRYEL